MKRPLLIAAAVLAVGVPTAHATSEPQIEIEDFAFVPARKVVRPGALVEWKNSDRAPHNATSFAVVDGKALFRTRTGNKGARLTARAPRKAGVYRYYCSIHPRMRGTLVVR